MTVPYFAFYVIVSVTFLPVAWTLLTVGPKNVTTQVNQSTYMNCSTTSERGVKWSLSGNTVICAGLECFDPYVERFRVENISSTGSWNLVISSVKTEDAGEYRCKEIGFASDQQSAHLIVLEIREKESTGSTSSDGLPYLSATTGMAASATTNGTMAVGKVAAVICSVVFILASITSIIIIVCVVRKRRNRRGPTKRPANEGHQLIATKVDYKEDPLLVTTIRTKASEEDRKGISGLAIADNELFITSFHTNDIEVYDLKSLTFSRSWRLDPLINPWDLGYCKVNEYLYVMDATYVDVPQKIFKVDRNGQLLKSWETRMGHGCISVTYDCNVVVAAYEDNTISEYTPDGQIVHEIKLSTKAGFAHPQHAIKLSNSRFLVSHGERKDPLHRVCVVNTNGDLKMSFGGQCGSTSDRLFVPIPLAIDSSGSIIVVDRDNSRVLLLSSSLKFMREIILRKKEGMHRPERIAVDQANGRVLLAHNDPVWTDCRVFVFEILQQHFS